MHTKGMERGGVIPALDSCQLVSISGKDSLKALTTNGHKCTRTGMERGGVIPALDSCQLVSISGKRFFKGINHE